MPPELFLGKLMPESGTVKTDAISTYRKSLEKEQLPRSFRDAIEIMCIPY
jgi:hypothetical protein